MMPIQCDACGIAYTPSAPKCPVCGKHDTPAAALRAWAEEEAERQLTDRVPADEVLRMMIAKSFPEHDAMQKLQEIQGRVRKKIRGEGRRRCLLASAILLLGLTIFLGGLYGGSLRLIIFGASLALLSLTAFLNGLWAMLAGRDDLFVADDLR
ncbi:MAG: hypothetical protein U0996_24760 [Planctomycetaceae bacterium]